MKRIAVFQYEWPLLAYTVDVAIKLSESGYAVDFFICNCDRNFIDYSKLESTKNLYVHNVPQFRGAKSLCAKLLSVLGYKTMFNPISNCAVAKVMGQLRRREYICYIGVEKKGLIWAGKIAESTQTPVLYYNTELYLEDHPSFVNDEHFNKLREQEIIYHKKSIATIIQDVSRAEVLLTCNKIEKTSVVYFPVSARGSLNYERSFYFHRKLGVEKDNAIILYFGSLSERRYSDKLAEFSKKMPDGCTMVLHGFGPKSVIDKLKEYENHDKLIVSTDMIPQGCIESAISSAKIGLVFYEDNCANDRLTAFSSEKIAWYLKSRIPIISFDIGNYRKLFDSYHCGELIVDLNGLSAAIQKILYNYKYYQINAASAFHKFYDFDCNFRRIQSYLDTL